MEKYNTEDCKDFLIKQYPHTKKSDWKRVKKYKDGNDILREFSNKKDSNLSSVIIVENEKGLSLKNIIKDNITVGDDSSRNFIKNLFAAISDGDDNNVNKLLGLSNSNGKNNYNNNSNHNNFDVMFEDQDGNFYSEDKADIFGNTPEMYKKLEEEEKKRKNSKHKDNLDDIVKVLMITPQELFQRDDVDIIEYYFREIKNDDKFFQKAFSKKYNGLNFDELLLDYISNISDFIFDLDETYMQHHLLEDEIECSLKSAFNFFDRMLQYSDKNLVQLNLPVSKVDKLIKNLNKINDLIDYESEEFKKEGEESIENYKKLLSNYGSKKPKIK